MDNGSVPIDTQPPSAPAPTQAPVSPAVTGPGEPQVPAPDVAEPVGSEPPQAKPAAGPNAAMSKAASFDDAASKLRKVIAGKPLASIAVASLAGLGAAVLLRR